MKRLAVAALALSLLGGSSALAQPDQHPNSGEPHRDHGGGAPHGGGGGGGGGPRGPEMGGGGAPHGGPMGAGPQGPSAPAVTPNAGPAVSHGAPGGVPGVNPNIPGAIPGATPNEHRGRFNGGDRGGFGRPDFQGGPGGQPNYRGDRQHGGPIYQGGGGSNRPNDARGPGRQPAPTFRAPPAGYHAGVGAPNYRPGGAQPRYNRQYFPRVYNPGRRFHWEGRGWMNQPGYYHRHWAYGDRLPWAWFDENWWIDDYWLYDLPVPPYGYTWVRVGPDALLVDLDTGMVVEVVPTLFF